MLMLMSWLSSLAHKLLMFMFMLVNCTIFALVDDFPLFLPLLVCVLYRMVMKFKNLSRI